MPNSDRSDFLVAMYNQLMNDINRHIIVVWQSIATLVAAIASLSLVEKNILTMDVATSIVVVTCVWLILHVIDASYWYNRNLVMIANIERQFLEQSDLWDIHNYFGKHRPENKMISHLKIQRALGLFVGGVILFAHYWSELRPWVNCEKLFEPINLMPWVIALVGICLFVRDTKQKRANYLEFLTNSPGIEIDSKDISYGSGHGHGKKK